MNERTARRASPSTRTLFLAGGIALAAVIAITAWLATRQKLPTKAHAIGARLELAAGDVTVSADGAKSQALSGTPLAIGSHIGTGKGSRALVRTGDGAMVFLRGETEIVLGEKGIAVEKGELWLEAPRADGAAVECALGKHVVSASDAGLSIRRAGADATVYVARGLSILTSPNGRIEINAGEQGTVHEGAAPTIAPVAFWQDWTGGMGDTRGAHASVGAGSGRIYGLDPGASNGAPARKLGIAQQAVRAVLRDGIAETEVDQTFSNPGGTPIEGWYWFTVPATATVTSFALETNGHLVEGEVIEKRDAAARYAAAVRQANDPALLEWVDGRTYRARIFPIPASGTRRVVLRYIEMLAAVEGKTRYVYPLRSDDPVRFDEFSLSVDLGTGAPLEVATALDARVEREGRLVTMRRSGYVPRADFQLEIAASKNAAARPVRAWRFEAGDNKADYVMLRYTPDVDFTKLPAVKGEVVVVVDTSAGGDEGARQLRTATAEAVLRAMSDQDRFALIALDVSPRVVYPATGLAPATEGDIAKALERLADHAVAGATDLGSMFEPALERVHGAEQPAIVYVGDGAPTSGETSSDALMDRLRRSLTGARARFFSVGIGADARHELLGQLARTGGGQHFRIDEAEQTTGAALRLTSAIKTPTLTDVEIDVGAGLDQPFYSSTGKLSRGEELVLFARTHHPLPPKLKVKWRAAGQDKTTDYPVSVEAGVTTSLVPRLWAAEYVRRLLGSGATADDNRGKVLELGVEYGLMTPYTSILALDSEASYARQGVVRRPSKLRGIRLTSIENEVHERSLAVPFLPRLPMTAMGCDRGAPSSGSSSSSSSKEVQGSSSDMRFPGASDRGGESPATVASPPASPSPVTTPASPVATASPSPVVPNDSSIAPSEGQSEFGAAAGGGGGGRGGANEEGRGGPRLPRSNVAPAGAARSDQERSAAKPARRPESVGRTEPAGTKTPSSPTTITDVNAKIAPIAKPSTWRRPLARCSDSASRPLAERLVLWQKRLKQAGDASAMVQQFEIARAACELPDWRDQAALLDLVQRRIDTEQAAEIVLSHFASEPDAQRFVARNVLRRTVDIRLAAAVSRVLFGGAVDWNIVDRDVLDLKKPKTGSRGFAPPCCALLAIRKATCASFDCWRRSVIAPKPLRTAEGSATAAS